MDKVLLSKGLAFLGGCLVGGPLGILAGRVLFEAKLREDYETRAETMKVAYEQALELQKKRSETPAVRFFKDNPIPAESKEVVLGIVQTQEIPQQRLETENPYHKAVVAVETPIETFVEGGVNDYGCSYIDEEDYLDEDGRFKGKMDVMMDDHNPVFLVDGHPIDDWSEKVGESIIVDFYKLVPPGVDPILYVRNHRTDEDWEVIQVQP